MEKKLLKKEKEIEKLKLKIRELEDKVKRAKNRTKEETKELEIQLSELRNEKQELIVKEETSSFEKEKIQSQYDNLIEKNRELLDKAAQIGVLKAESKGLELKNEELKMEIENLNAELRGKDDEINRAKSVEFNLREEIKQKNFEIKDLSSAIGGKESELSHFNEHSQVMENKIASLQAEIKSMQAEKEELEIEKIKVREGLPAAENGIISNLLPNLIKGDQQALDKIKEILERIKHNAIIGIPILELLPDLLPAEEIKRTQNIRIMTYIDFENPKDKTIFDQYSDMPNVKFRNYDQKNVWGIIRDQEEMLIAPDDAAGNPVGIVITDSFQIEILGNIMLNMWAKCKQNVAEYHFKS